MPEGTHHLSNDLKLANREEFDLRQGSLRHLLHEIGSMWPLDLDAESIARPLATDQLPSTSDITSR